MRTLRLQSTPPLSSYPFQLNRFNVVIFLSSWLVRSRSLSWVVVRDCCFHSPQGRMEARGSTLCCNSCYLINLWYTFVWVLVDSHISSYIWYPVWGKYIYIDLRKLKLSWGQLTGCVSHAGHGAEMSWNSGLSTAWYLPAVVHRDISKLDSMLHGRFFSQSKKINK